MFCSIFFAESETSSQIETKMNASICPSIGCFSDELLGNHARRIGKMKGKYVPTRFKIEAEGKSIFVFDVDLVGQNVKIFAHKSGSFTQFIPTSNSY